MLTIIFVFIFLLYVSYTATKYSDFCHFGFYKIFQISCIIDGMGILDNFENAWDIDFQYESAPIKPINNAGEPSLATKIFSETCCDGCTCKASSDHDTEFQMEELDFNI